MANRKNITTKQGKSKAVKPQNSKASTSVQASVPLQDLTLTVPLVVVLVYCLIWGRFPLLEVISTIFSSAPLSPLITPTLPFLLVPVFCCLALYLLLRKRGIGKFATITTLIFTAVVLCFIVGSILGAGKRCGDFDCSSANALRFYALFLYNPLANLLWNTLSATGIVLLVRRLK